MAQYGATSCCHVPRWPAERETGRQLAAAEKHMPQLQHNMLVTGARKGYLSILTGGGKWVVIEVDADPVYQTVLLQVERIFWRCVSTGEVPVVYGAVPPKAKRPVSGSLI